METKKTRLFALLACLFMLFANHVQAQGTDDLQEFIDNLAKAPATRAGTPTDIDLSAYSEPRTTTLYIRNGVNVRFINGTLTRATSLTDAPLVQIIGNSTLHVAESATISGGNFVTSVTLVEVKDGELDMEGGKVIGNIEKTSTLSRLGFSVTLNDAKAVISMNDGEIQYLCQYQTAKASTMNINGGTFNWIKINGHATMKGSINSAISFGGKDTYIELIDWYLDSSSNLRLYDCEDGQVAVRNVKSKETASCIELGNRDKDKFDLIYENNSLIVRSKTSTDPNLITSEVDLQKRLDEIAAENPSNPVTLTIQENGVTITNTIVAGKGCNAIITGGKITVSKDFNIRKPSNCIFDNDGDLTFQDITIDGNSIPFENNFFSNFGTLIIGNNVRYENIYQGELRYGFYLSTGMLIIHSGDLKLNGPIFYPSHGGKVTIYGGNFQSLNNKDIIAGDITATILGGRFSGGTVNIWNLYLGDAKLSAIPELNVSSIKSSNIYIYRPMSLPLINLGNMITLDWTYRTTNPLMQYQGKWRITKDWTKMELEKPFVVSGNEIYPMSQDDFNNMEFVNMPSDREAYFDKANKCVKLRLKKDPNLIESEDDLQKRLDEIATSSNKKEELTIAEKGITLTKGVYVRAGTSVTLKGGTISLADSFNDNAAFYLEREAYLTYNDIKINLRNVYLPTSFVQSLAFSYLNILDNVEFTNIYNGPKAMTKGFFYCYINISPKNSIFSIEVNRGSVIYGLGPEIILRNCSLKSNGGYPTIAGDGAVYMYDHSQVFGDGNASSVIDLPRGFLSMFYGENTLVHADNNGNVVNVENGELSSGKFEGSEATFNSVRISDNFDFDISQLTLIGSNTGDIQISGNASLPRVYVMNGVLIKLTSAMTDTWIIDGDWSNFGVENPYTLISGYNYKITEADYSRMQFANLPDDIEAVYNDDLKVVQLQKRAKECDLQSLIDGLCDAGKNVPVPEGVTDIGCEEIDFLDPLQCIVDRSFDGGNETDETGKPIKTICLCGSGPQIQIVRINKYSSLTISNYNISSSKFENQYFQVYGTLIIDVNVHIYHFIRFIHIMPGGRVIWRGGYTEDVDEIVHNEGGTLEIEGDFDNGGKPFVNPAGSTLIIRDGTFNIDIENYGILIIKGGYVKGKIKNYGEFNMSGGTVNGGGERDIYNYDGGKVVIYNGSDIGGGTGCIWSETDVWIEGDVQVTDIHIKRGCRIHVIGKLTVIWNIHFFVFDDFNVYVPFIFGDEGYQLTKEDFANLRIDLPDAYRWEYYDGVVVIVRIPYDVMTIVEYLDYFGPHGNLDHPWSFIYNKTNFNINIDWHILRDYHLIFDGGTFTMNGSIYIDEGASLWLKNIRFKGVGHHIYVYGTLYIDENVDFAEMVKFIHICKGGKIRFVTQPTYIVNIFISEENIETYKSIISDIKEEWLQFINIELPDGYRWIFIDGTIVIVRIPYDVVTLVEFLDFFGPQGTPGYPWSFIYNTTNININIDWHILRDYHLIFDGGTFTMNGGDIYIDEGASLWLKNIRFKGFDRHIYVYGTLYIDENVDFAEIVKFIHICKGGEIRFVTKPDYVVNIIIEEEHILTDVAVIYDIITEWLEYLHIDLPEGYEWKYDDDTHTITISFASGINNILVDESGDEPVYDMSGKRQLKPRKGLNIIKGKKVVVR